MKSVESINPPPVAEQACKSVVQTIYDIVKAHGGELRVKPKEVSRSTFFIILPIQ